MSRLHPTQFPQRFIHWVESVNEGTNGELLAIDDKALRCSDDRLSAIHMISAFASANGVVMGQLKTDAKANEITVIPPLLKLLDIKGCLRFIDAMGCQTDIASTIVQQGGDYLLAVRDNQELLHPAVQQALKPLHSAATNPANVTIEKGHGRIETREYQVLPADNVASQFPEWKGLKTLGVTIGYRLEKSGKQSLDYRYYISSAERDKAHFAAAVRGHWRIENCLHWVLDLSMKEDACPIYRGEAAEILACMRHLALNMLRAATTKKPRIRRKKKIVSISSTYLEQVLIARLRSMGKK